ncbi:MAG: hypothetical protein PHY47_20680 [Lachnospiraceae bacterium]|nr:hypothetical protein [Lachnospiraceae bacterium]
MMDYNFTEHEANQIAVCLYEIYEAIVFDENKSIVHYSITSIAVNSVETQNKLDIAFFDEHKGIAFAYESHNELTKRFLSKIKILMDDAFNTVSKIATTYSNVTDIMAVTVPYVMLKFGVDNQEIGLFVGLGILVSQIIVERIAENKGNKTHISREEFLQFIKINQEFLNSVAESDVTKPLLQYKQDLLLLMEKLDND